MRQEEQALEFMGGVLFRGSAHKMKSSFPPVLKATKFLFIVATRCVDSFSPQKVQNLKTLFSMEKCAVCTIIILQVLVYSIKAQSLANVTEMSRKKCWEAGKYVSNKIIANGKWAFAHIFF